jgi:type III secretion protein D
MFEAPQTPWSQALPPVPSAPPVPIHLELNKDAAATTHPAAGQYPFAASASPRLNKRQYAVAVVSLIVLTLASWGLASSWVYPAAHETLNATHAARALRAENPLAKHQPDADIAQTPAPTSAQLAALLRSELKERALDQQIELIETTQGWTLRGDLDVEQQTQLERLLNKFQATYRPNFEIHALILPSARLLPFKIVQVSGGANANVLTNTGKRLFPGDSWQGYRLVAINGNRLLFDGPRKLELAW